jgi:release factor glutamine methyltransferase
MMMRETAAALLLAARKALVAADIDGSSLDARLMLQAASGLSHEELVANPDALIEEKFVSKFKDFLNRRLAHEPVSRILGSREFYGRAFLVTPDVLDPRPDTETVIELAAWLPRPKQGKILDLGTGSGILAVTLLCEWKEYSAVVIDVSARALKVAHQNAISHNVDQRLTLHHGSWFEGLSGQFDLIVSNPPYITTADIPRLEIDVKDYDPLLALDGGSDGLFAYRAIAAGAGKFLTPFGAIVVEIGAHQEQEVMAIFVKQGFAPVTAKRDLGGHLRALAFKQINSPEKKPL